MKLNKRIAIIGLGNVGGHLLAAFQQNSISVSEIYNRDYSISLECQQKTGITPISNLSNITADLCFVCVSDHAINEVINQLPKHTQIAYTSGSVQLKDLDRQENVGVFYPLQTFSKGFDLDYSVIPFFIEANNIDFQNELHLLASKISHHVHNANSTQRKQMHLAAVFINNFVNHQIYIAEQLANEFSFDVSFLHPLLTETINKAILNGAFDSQTGPAKRRDNLIIESHETMLTNEHFKHIYQSITKSIISTYYDKL
jgi:predicted short-subunit dehydrogenase-like oxidoreductase (DUF2520 family)